jgi:hypothetical protein
LTLGSRRIALYTNPRHWIVPLATPSELLDKYQNAAEALLDALFALGARIHTEDPKEYARLRKLVEKCRDDLEQARLEFERGVPEDLKRSG